MRTCRLDGAKCYSKKCTESFCLDAQKLSHSPHAQLASRLRRIASGEWMLNGDEWALAKAADILDSIEQTKKGDKP